VTDEQQIDALAYQLMLALDKIDLLKAENRKLRRNLQFADDLIWVLDKMEEDR
jgi:hypothetical protein